MGREQAEARRGRDDPGDDKSYGWLVADKGGALGEPGVCQP
jgi:hypothetical protein